MRKHLEYIYILGIFCFLQSCTQEIKIVGGIVQVQIESYVFPPRAGNCLDSLKSAFENAAQVSGYGETHFNSDLFSIAYNPQNDFVVRVDMNRYPIKIWVNKRLIRQYNWNGYLLIALHEWYHIYLHPKIDNDIAHATMVNSQEYHRWIAETLNCTLEAARWLAYIGTENTPVYDSLTWAEKMVVEDCKKMYNITN